MKKFLIAIGLLLGLSTGAFAGWFGGDTFEKSLSTVATEVGYPGTVNWIYIVSNSTWSQNVVLYDNTTEKFKVWVTTASATEAVKVEVKPNNMKFKTSIKVKCDAAVTTTCPVRIYLGID